MAITAGTNLNSVATSTQMTLVNNYIDLDNFEFGGVCSIEVYYKFETRKDKTAVVQFSHTGKTSFNDTDYMALYTTSNSYYNLIRNNGKSKL